MQGYAATPTYSGSGKQTGAGVNAYATDTPKITRKNTGHQSGYCLNFFMAIGKLCNALPLVIKPVRVDATGRLFTLLMSKKHAIVQYGHQSTRVSGVYETERRQLVTCLFVVC